MQAFLSSRIYYNSPIYIEDNRCSGTKHLSYDKWRHITYFKMKNYSPITEKIKLAVVSGHTCIMQIPQATSGPSDRGDDPRSFPLITHSMLLLLFWCCLADAPSARGECSIIIMTNTNGSHHAWKSTPVVHLLVLCTPIWKFPNRITITIRRIWSKKSPCTNTPVSLIHEFGFNHDFNQLKTAQTQPDCSIHSF
jgi:hypothetical protein